MVQSTGAANAEYLRSLVLRGEGDGKLEREKQLDGQRRWLASSRWAAAAQFALAVSLTSSQNDLVQLEINEEESILKKTRDAVITLQGVLEGKHNKEIEDNLDKYQVSGNRWWSSLYKMIEGKTCLLLGTIIFICRIHAFLVYSCVRVSRPGLAVMSRLARNKLHQGDNFEDRTIDWDNVGM